MSNYHLQKIGLNPERFSAVNALDDEHKIIKKI